MAEILTHPLAIDGKRPENLRGDPITADRYTSPAFMQREWDGLWTKIWHIAGREAELVEAGDYVVHDFMQESVFIARQADGSLKGFYNVCAHRAQRLAARSGSQEALTCPYHGWVWNMDGSLKDAPDRSDFPQGDPCGKVTLVEVRVDTWAGFVWYTMDEAAPPLREYLDPIPEIYRNFPLDTLVRVQWVRVALETNWKFFSDNFSESYHTRTAHPQIPPIIDQDHFTSRYEMFPRGHARIVQMGRPSLRDRLPDHAAHPFDAQLRAWDLDPAAYPDFETKVMQGWKDLKAAKAAQWKARGFSQYEKLTEEELTESNLNVVFPNIAFSVLAEGTQIFRWEPHPTDPEKCFFDLWVMSYPVEGQTTYTHRTSRKEVPFREAEVQEIRDYDEGRGVMDLSDTVVFQDWSLTAGQQAGWRSRGYQEPYLAGQETRVRRFHEVLNDYLAGRPPGR